MKQVVIIIIIIIIIIITIIIITNTDTTDRFLWCLKNICSYKAVSIEITLGATVVHCLPKENVDTS
jgi:uncharacterized protein YxeA